MAERMLSSRRVEPHILKETLGINNRPASVTVVTPLRGV